MEKSSEQDQKRRNRGAGDVGTEDQGVDCVDTKTILTKAQPKINSIKDIQSSRLFSMQGMDLIFGKSRDPKWI